ncbi:MAG: hypothetical protein R6V14_04675 [Halanaerobiales bacterium]
MKKVADIFSIGAQFVEYCRDEGWLIEKDEGRKKIWYVSKEGEKELKKLNIEV